MWVRQLDLSFGKVVCFIPVISSNTTYIWWFGVYWIPTVICRPRLTAKRDLFPSVSWHHRTNKNERQGNSFPSKLIWNLKMAESPKIIKLIYPTDPTFMDFHCRSSCHAAALSFSYSWERLAIKRPRHLWLLDAGLVSGTFYRKPLYFMGKTMVACSFSLQAIRWIFHNYIDF